MSYTYLNLFLESSNKLSKVDLINTPLAGRFTTQTQFTALSMWLSNFIKYEGKTIRFVSGQKNTLPLRENPNRIGQRSIKGVIDALADVGLVKVKLGKNPYKGEGRLPEVIANRRIVSFSKKLITFEISKQKMPPFVLLAKRKGYKSKHDTPVEFRHTPYTREIEQTMKEYNEYLNKQKIECNGEIFSDFHITRKYQVLIYEHKTSIHDYINPFRHGGRGGGAIANMKKEDRPKIKINGKATVQIDMHCSYLNFLYREATGKWLDRDAYDIGYSQKYRDVFKTWFQIILGSKSIRGVNTTLTKYYRDEASDKWKKLYDQLLKEIGGKKNRKEVSETIIRENPKVSQYFLLGKAFQTHLQWLEANMIFNVAHQLAMADIPCLTVHDEYIVCKEDEDYVRQIMFSTGYQTPDLYTSKRIKRNNA